MNDRNSPPTHNSLWRSRAAALTVASFAAVGLMACEDRTDGPFVTKELAAEERGKLERNRIENADRDEVREELGELRAGAETTRQENRISAMEARLADVEDRFHASNPAEATEARFERMKDLLEERIDEADDEFGELQPANQAAYEARVQELERALAQLESMTPAAPR